MFYLTTNKFRVCKQQTNNYIAIFFRLVLGNMNIAFSWLLYFLISAFALNVRPSITIYTCIVGRHVKLKKEYSFH